MNLIEIHFSCFQGWRCVFLNNKVNIRMYSSNNHYFYVLDSVSFKTKNPPVPNPDLEK